MLGSGVEWAGVDCGGLGRDARVWGALLNGMLGYGVDSWSLGRDAVAGVECWWQGWNAGISGGTLGYSAERRGQEWNARV